MYQAVSLNSSTGGQRGDRGAPPPVGGGAPWQRCRGVCPAAAAAPSTGEGPAADAAMQSHGAAGRPAILLIDGGGAATQDGR